jgi:O-antigen ligase
MLFGIDLFKRTGNPNGNSMLQRREYWKAGWNLFIAHPVFGVGTGDLKESFKQYYIDTDSRLLPEYRHRAHNQYLSISIALGIIGLVIFFTGLFYPPYILKRHRVWYFTVILSIVVLSFIAEDTLETQAGATFTAFFYSLFLWGTLSPKEEKPKTQRDENL